VAGEFDRAEATARSITDPYPQATGLAKLAEALAVAGEFDRAEATARSITDPYAQAQVMTRLATFSATAAENSVARLIAAAFHLGTWTLPLSALVKHQPAVLAALAAEVRIEDN
jgi:hypothetical protein